MTTTALPVPATPQVRSNYTFVIDRRGDDHFFLLLDEATLSGPRPLRPVYVMTVSGRAMAESFLRWLEARRDLWHAWGKLAAQRGGDFLGDLIDRLMEAAPPPELPDAFSIRAVPGDDRALVLLGAFASKGPMPSVELWRGHFANRGARDRAFRWLHEPHRIREWDLLAELAEREGAEAVQAFIDAGIAACRVDRK